MVGGGEEVGEGGSKQAPRGRRFCQQRDKTGFFEVYRQS